MLLKFALMTQLATLLTVSDTTPPYPQPGDGEEVITSSVCYHSPQRGHDISGTIYATRKLHSSSQNAAQELQTFASLFIQSFQKIMRQNNHDDAQATRDLRTELSEKLTEFNTLSDGDIVSYRLYTSLDGAKKCKSQTSPKQKKRSPGPTMLASLQHLTVQ